MIGSARAALSAVIASEANQSSLPSPLAGEGAERRRRDAGEGSVLNSLSRLRERVRKGVIQQVTRADA